GRVQEGRSADARHGRWPRRRLSSIRQLMNLKRRAVLVLALLAAVPAAARDMPYLTVQELDLVSVLPPPVVDPEQLAMVLAAQRAATPERIEQAKRDVDESPDTMFGAVLGKPLDAAALPNMTRLFERMRDTEDA